MSVKASRQFFYNAAASWFVNILKSVLQLMLIPIMARLLSPQDYGIYALAFPIILFFAALADGGLGASLAREDEANTEVWSTAFWLMLMICVVLALIISLTGVLLAKYTGQIELESLLPVLSLVLPLISLTILADARLTRRGNLLYHSAAELCAFILGATIAVFSAYQGAGYWSLTFQYLASYTVRALVMNYAVGVAPALVFKPEVLKNHLNIGGGLVLSRGFELIGKAIENGLFGHFFGITHLGSYTFASQIARFGCDAATNPLVGAFYARALHESERDVAALHAQLTRALLMTLAPATLYLAILSPVILPLFLGNKWYEASQLLSLIIVPFGISSIAWLSSQIALKHGLSNRTALVVSICSLARALIVLSGYYLSIFYVVCIISTTYLVQALLITIVVPRRYTFNLTEMAKVMLRPTIVLFITCGLVVTMSRLINLNPFHLILLSILSLIVYFLGLTFCCGAVIKKDILSIKNLIKI